MSFNHNKLKFTTTGKIFRHIYRNRSTSRSELAELFGLSPAMITSVITHLQDLELVETIEDGKKQVVTSGRKKTLLTISPKELYFVGVDVSSHYFRYCISDYTGTILFESETIPEPDDFMNINQVLVLGIQTFLKNCKFAPSQITGIGLSVPGHLNHETGELISHRKHWKNFNFYTIKEKLSLPIVMENNVRAMAYYQYLFQTDSCPENFALLHVGSGIVCTNFSDGQLITGNYISGEVGHTVVNVNGVPCECGKRGCLQTYASKTALLEKAKLIHATVPSSYLCQLVEHADDITIETILTAYELGDPIIVHTLKEAIQYLGITVSNLAIILNPEKVLIHNILLSSKQLQTEFNNFTQSQLQFVVHGDLNDIEIMDYNPWISTYGAAALAVDHLFIQTL